MNYPKPLAGYFLTGSSGGAGLVQASSFVGKSSVATALRPEGFLTCSLADEIRFALTGDDQFSNLVRRNLEPRKVEGSDFKNKLVDLGESYNLAQPWGWAILAACKMIHSEIEPQLLGYEYRRRGFVVDDVRRPNEFLLLSHLGLEGIEIKRTDGKARQYGSDGRISSVSDISLDNDGLPGAIKEIVEAVADRRIMSRAERLLALAHRSHRTRGLIRFLYHSLNERVRNKLARSSEFQSYFLEENFYSDPSSEVAALRVCLVRMIWTIRDDVQDVLAVREIVR